MSDLTNDYRLTTRVDAVFPEMTAAEDESVPTRHSFILCPGMPDRRILVTRVLSYDRDGHLPDQVLNAPVDSIARFTQRWSFTTPDTGSQLFDIWIERPLDTWSGHTGVTANLGPPVLPQPLLAYCLPVGASLVYTEEFSSSIVTTPAPPHAWSFILDVAIVPRSFQLAQLETSVIEAPPLAG